MSHRHRSYAEEEERVQTEERKALRHMRSMTGKTLQRILDDHASDSVFDRDVRKMVQAELRRRGPASDPGRGTLARKAKAKVRGRHAAARIRRHHAVRIPLARRAAVSRRIRALVKKGYSPAYAARLAYHPGSGRDPGRRRPGKGSKTKAGHLTAAQRKKLRPSQFALPARRQLPLVDARHVRNAAARLAQMKKRGTVTRAEYREARGRIARAAAKAGSRNVRRDPHETRDYEYVVYPSTRVEGHGIKIHGTGFKAAHLTEAKRVAKTHWGQGWGAGIYSVSKGRFVGWINRSGRYAPFR